MTKETKVYLETNTNEKDKIEELRRVMMADAQGKKHLSVFELSEILLAENRKELNKIFKKYYGK